MRNKKVFTGTQLYLYQNVFNSFRDWRIVLCFAPCSLYILWVARRDFWGRQEGGSGQAGTGRMEAAWPEHADPCLGLGSEGAWCLLQQLPTCHCGCLENQGVVEKQLLRGCPHFYLTGWNIQCNFLPVHGKGILQFPGGQAGKLTAQSMVASMPLVQWSTENRVLNWVIFIAYLVNKGCDI